MVNEHKIIKNLYDIYNFETGTYTFDSKPFLRNDASWFSVFMPPIVPFVSVLLYLVLTKPLFKFLRDYFKIQPKGTLLQLVTITHSGILAVYSGWTAYNTIQIFYAAIVESNGLLEAVCDRNGSLWIGKDLSFWATHFYISKFYEFIDTIIIILKGNDPIFLQTYHHAGIVICMWALVVSSSSILAFAVSFNSSIHTLMYTYYVFAAFGFRSPLKNYLTQMQLVQFFLGIAIAFPTHFMKDCLTPFEKISTGLLQIYGFILIGLFWSFYVDTYIKKNNDSKSTKKAV